MIAGAIHPALGPIGFIESIKWAFFRSLYDRLNVSDCQKSPVQPTCADGRDTYRTAKLSCCLRQKQAKRSWGSRPNLRARCGARWKFGQRQPLALRVCEPLCGECAVQRSILSPGTAKLRRVQRTKQPKHNESEALPAAETAELRLGQLSKFTSALRRAMEIWLTAIKGAAVCLLQARCDGRSKSREPQPPRGRNFCPAYAGRNGFPLERVVFRHEDRLQSLSLFCLRGWNFRHVRPG